MLFFVQPKNKYSYLINQKVAEEKDQMVSWPLLSDEITEPDFIYSSKWDKKKAGTNPTELKSVPF